MISLTLKQLISITEGKCFGDENTHFQGISIDSRNPQRNSLFVAIQGENLNGHDFIGEAKANGAVALLVSKPVDSELPYILVKDTTLALGKIGQFWRTQFDIPFIALTGSNGKTTTKNMIEAILIEANAGKSHAVFATRGNFNNHIGLPLMLCSLNDKHRIAVIEMGMNHFGELSYLTGLVSPSSALITNAGPSHLEGVGNSVEGVAKAKGEIFEGLSKSGIAVINADDIFSDYWKKLCASHRIVTFGINHSSDIQGEIKEKGFVLHYQNQSIEIKLQLLGRHNIMNALAASAVTLVNGATLENIKKALENMQPSYGRMQPKAGKNGATIIDDTYNANPLSLDAALNAISEFPGEKILVLGDMKELGEQSVRLHHESGLRAKNLGISLLFATGELSRHAVNSFGENSSHFSDQSSMILALEKYLKPNTTILVKGSRSMKMEQVVNAIVLKE